MQPETLLHSTIKCTGQLGFHMDSLLVRGAGGVLLVAWIAFWLVVAKRLGTEGQLKGDTEIY